MVQDRMLVITDLFLGAVWADEEFSEDEHLAVRQLIAELLDLGEEGLPESVTARIQEFEPLTFDLPTVAAEFAEDPPMAKRRLLALVGRMVDADGVVEAQEEKYLQDLAAALGLEVADWSDLSLAYSIEELRETFTQLRSPPPPMVDPSTRESRPPPPPMVVEQPTPPVVLPEQALPPRDED